MVRRLDDTRVGEYKNNWFFELVQLLISILGCVAVFLVPITYLKSTSADGSEILDGVSPVSYLFTQPDDCYLKTLSIVVVSFFGLVLLNIFLTLAIAKVNKSIYVKISKVIEILCALACFVLIGYYMYSLFNTATLINMGEVKSLIKNIFIYLAIIELALINAIFMYFNSKKVSIYD